VVKIRESVPATIEVQWKHQDEFRRQYGPDYRAGLDLMFANPDGTLLKPDSVSAAASLLFRRLRLPKSAASTHYATPTHRIFLRAVCR
jgi:hypothetical protein